MVLLIECLGDITKDRPDRSRVCDFGIIGRIVLAAGTRFESIIENLAPQEKDSQFNQGDKGLYKLTEQLEFLQVESKKEP